MKLDIRALSWAVVIVIWFIAGATIGAELLPPLKDFFAGLAGHHWTGKGIVSVGVFIVGYMAVAAHLNSRASLSRAVYLVGASAVVGSLVILSFFILHNYGI